MAGVREQPLGIPAGPPPILVTAEVVGHARSFIGGDELLATLVEIEEKSLKERNGELRSRPPDPLTAWQAASVVRSLGYETQTSRRNLFQTNRSPSKSPRCDATSRVGGPHARTI
jgi:hypothetical protein